MNDFIRLLWSSLRTTTDPEPAPEPEPEPEIISLTWDEIRAAASPTPQPPSYPRPDPDGLRIQPPPSYVPAPANIQPPITDPPFGTPPTNRIRPSTAPYTTGKPTGSQSVTPWELCWKSLTPAEKAWTWEDRP